jgi:hypothetical protein
MTTEPTNFAAGCAAASLHTPEPTEPLLRCYRDNGPEREKLEQYISGIFHTCYGAAILEYLPLLFALQRDGRFSAALGLRSAAQDSLFTEQYLEQRVETLVNDRFGIPADRSRIMELGNLAASTPGDSILLYLLITAIIHGAGISHLLFTANRAVRLSIRRCGFSPMLIGPANPLCLGKRAAAWGRYYDSAPMVMVGDLSLTMKQAESNPRLAALLLRYQPEIEQHRNALRLAISRAGDRGES